MFTLQWCLLFALAVFVFGDQVLQKTCPEFHCKLSDANIKYASVAAQNVTELHLNFCTDLQVLKITPNLNTLTLEHCFDENFEFNNLEPVANIKHLKFQNGNLSVLRSNEFVILGDLKILDLGGNSITSLSSDTFANLTHLRQLGLQDNALKILPQNVFQSLENLQFLDLSNNRITYLSRDIFGKQSNLQTLLLRGNPFTEVALPDFDLQVIDLSICLQLKSLKLSSNVDTLIMEHSGIERLISRESIRTLKAGFSKLKDLQLNNKSSPIELDLQGCRLGFTGSNLSELLCNLWNLQRLDLSNNSLETIPRKYKTVSSEICQTPSLNYLNLSDNRLLNLSMESFLFGPRLVVLDLSYNRLENVSLKSFEAATNELKTLHLEGNKLTNLDYTSINSKSFKNLKELFFHDNCFELSFYKNMIKYLRAMNIRLLEEETPTPVLGDSPKKPQHKWSVYDILIVVFVLGVLAYVRMKLYRREEDNCCFGMNCCRKRTNPNEEARAKFINQEVYL